LILALLALTAVTYALGIRVQEFVPLLTTSTASNPHLARVENGVRVLGVLMLVLWGAGGVILTYIEAVENRALERSKARRRHAFHDEADSSRTGLERDAAWRACFPTHRTFFCTSSRMS
jgi:hypothetical protein